MKIPSAVSVKKFSGKDDRTDWRNSEKKRALDLGFFIHMDFKVETWESNGTADTITVHTEVPDTKFKGCRFFGKWFWSWHSSILQN